MAVTVLQDDNIAYEYTTASTYLTTMSSLEVEAVGLISTMWLFNRKLPVAFLRAFACVFNPSP